MCCEFMGKSILIKGKGGKPFIGKISLLNILVYYISFLSSQYSHSRRVPSPLTRKLLGRYSS